MPARLAEALGHPAAERDLALAQLEGCEGVPAGFVRALRAELAGPGCADVWASPLVGPEAEARVSAPYREILVALGLGARLDRLARHPPAVPGARDKATLNTYFQETLFPWIAEQATAIQQLASQGAQLSGYARGIVAVEAGMADMRFVEIARAVPIPDEMAKDRELSEIYYSSLDEGLEPRKARGRDAALVGLLELARLGVHHDPRVDAARELLSRVFGGSHVTALDQLLLPPLPALHLDSNEARLAATLPAPYSGALLGELEWTPPLVRALLERGMPLGVQRQLEASADTELRYLGARARFTSGTLYFRREDFQGAEAELGRLLALSDLPADLRADAGLLRALALALSAGPADAVALLAHGPRFADALGNLSLLDNLANGKGVVAGRAAFDGAFLRELVAEPGNASQWQQLSALYQRATTLLRGAEQKLARERQQAASATARAITAR